MPPPAADSFRNRIAPPLAAILLLWIVAFPQLDRYGVNWDEALGDLFYGERYVFYLGGFDPQYLDFSADPFPAGRLPDLRPVVDYPPWASFPVSSMLAVGSSLVLRDVLGWLEPFGSYHAANLLLAALFVWFFYRFLEREFGLLAALCALGLLFGSPRIFAHLMANTKDFPVLVFFSLTLVAFLRAWERGSTAGLLGAGALLGVALGVKPNALFVPPVVFLVVVLGRLPAVWSGRRVRMTLALLGSGLLSIPVFVATWPWLWSSPIAGLKQFLYYIFVMRQDLTRPESVAPVAQAVLLTTPPLLLALAAVGLVPVVRRALRRDRAAILLLAWIAVVLGRYLPPQATNFDGVRHFIELFPPLAAVAAVGALWSIERAAGFLPRLATPVARAALVALACLPGAWAVAHSHPFQLAYWNVFAGGPRGAYARGLPQAGDYWALSYPLGLHWLDEHAEPGSFLGVPVAEHSVRMAAPLQLREDIELLALTSPYEVEIDPRRMAQLRELARQRTVYVMFVERRDWANALTRDCLERLEPERVWELDGAPVLSIYRYRSDGISGNSGVNLPPGAGKNG